jgi:hypothetical protein
LLFVFAMIRSFRSGATVPVAKPLGLLLTVALIAVGCGGSKPSANVVRGDGFRFTAPSGWKVTGGGTQVTAGGTSAFVRVSRYPLVKEYTDALFQQVTRDEQARMDAVAASEHGRVVGRGVASPGGIRSHVWRLSNGGSLDEYTFVLAGKREFELLCRRPATGSDAACKQLVQSFALS